MTQPFLNPTQLNNWLTQQNIATVTWGRQQAKSVQDLWQELQLGESQLTSNPVQRIVRVVSLIIKQDGKRLIEVGQTLHDGRTRQRNRAPSEKMQQGETYVHAAIRCLEEELNIPANQCQLLLNTHRVEQQHADAHSYPSLPTCYHMHYVQVMTPLLPNMQFSTPNREANPHATVQSHSWDWVVG